MRRAPVIETIWSAGMTLAAPALWSFLRHRARRGKEIEARLPERRGIDPSARPDGPLVWLHAASVGETMSILPVLSALAARAPAVTILLTTGTVTSASLLEQRLPRLGLVGRVRHRFVPLDVPVWTGRFLDHWRPGAVAFVESELWPNILRACRDRHIPAMLINARMSARSFRTWSRAPAAARTVLSGFAAIRARGPEDARRLRSLGATRLTVAGDLKFAAAPLPACPADLGPLDAMLAGRRIFLAASTHPGEEMLIQQAHRALSARFPGLLTMIVPRHPERGGELSEQLGAPRRRLGEPPPERGIWLADTLGELGLWYRLCDVAFVGRSLIAPGGGQNPLEPARLGCPIVTGPNTGNFREHVALLRRVGGLAVAEDNPDLIRIVGGASGRCDGAFPYGGDGESRGRDRRHAAGRHSPGAAGVVALYPGRPSR